MEFMVLARRQQKSYFEDLMVFMKGYNNHVPFESGTDDAEEGTDV